MIINPGELKFGMRAGSYPVITTSDDFVKYTETQKESFVVEFAGAMIPIADIATGARLFIVNPKNKQFYPRTNIKTRIRRISDFREKDTDTFIVSAKSNPKDSGIVYIEADSEVIYKATGKKKEKEKKTEEAELKEGSKAILTAIPTLNYYFDKWTGDLTGEIEPITITVDSDKKIIAHFKKEKGEI